MSTRNLSVDTLKIVLAVFVVLLHCNIFRENHKILSFLSVQGLFRVAVPVFFLINGYFLKSVYRSSNIKNWIKRVLILYSVWMLLYTPLWFRFNSTILLNNILDGYHHLWYLRAMLIAGIILYALKNLSSKKLFFLSLLLFFIGCSIQYLGNYSVFGKSFLNTILNTTYIHRNFLFLGFPFMTIGYLLSRVNWNDKLSKNQIFLISLFSIILLLFESYCNFIFTNKGIDNLFSLILLCPLIFILTLNLSFSFKVDSKMIAKISTAIYLTHPWIIFLLGAIYSFDSISLAILTLPIATIFSFVLIKLDTKLKILF